MLDYKMKMLAHHERKMGNKAIPILPQAVNKDPELFTEACAHITATMYAINEVIVRFETRLGNNSYFGSAPGKMMADGDSGKTRWVRKE
jgi:hypothetical protein